MKDPKNKYRLGTVSKYFTGRLKLVSRHQPHPLFTLLYFFYYGIYVLAQSYFYLNHTWLINTMVIVERLINCVIFTSMYVVVILERDIKASLAAKVKKTLLQTRRQTSMEEMVAIPINIVQMVCPNSTANKDMLT